MAVHEHIVDVRDEEPPRPFQMALAAARGLVPGECVVMLHRREPIPLYAALEELGFAHQTSRDVLADGEPIPVRVMIWRADDAAAAAHCGGRG